MHHAMVCFAVVLTAFASAFAGCARADEGGLLRRLLQRDLGARAAKVPDWLQDVSMSYGGMERSFYLHVPQGHGGGAGAVLVFHGGMGNGVRIARQTDMARLADQRGFIAVFPNATDAAWNDGRATTASPADDVGFVLAVIDYLAAEWSVDPARVFATGASNGGMFTLRLACDAADRFAAFATVVANLPANYASRCAPSQPVRLMMVNGTADRLMKWDGGTIPSNRLLGIGKGGDVISTPDTLKFWLGADGCQDDSETSSLPDRFDDGTQVVRHAYTSCRPGGEVILYEVLGGGHNWPGTPVRPRGRKAGNVSYDLDATETIVDFFARYGL